jgi:hypothetical protein
MDTFLSRIYPGIAIIIARKFVYTVYKIIAVSQKITGTITIPIPTVKSNPNIVFIIYLSPHPAFHLTIYLFNFNSSLSTIYLSQSA